MNFHLHGEKISRCSWATVCQTSRVIFFNVLRSLPRFSKEVATFRSYFYLFPFSFLQNLIFPRKLVVIQFHIPFLLPFPPLLNYDSKHRLPLFRVPAFHRCPPLFRIFFVHFNYESPLFLASLNEFHSDWILSFPFSFSTRPSFPISNLVSPPRSSTFLSFHLSTRCNRYVRLLRSPRWTPLADRTRHENEWGKRLYCLFERELHGSSRFPRGNFRVEFL